LLRTGHIRPTSHLTALAARQALPAIHYAREFVAAVG